MKTQLIWCFLIFICTIYAASSQATLVGYYPFTGNAKDSSGRNHDGVVFDCELVCDRFGNDNSAYYFNGQSYITIEDHKDFLFGPSDSMTIAAWVKCSVEQPDFAGIVVKGPINTNRPGFQLIFLSPNRPTVEVTIPDNDFGRLTANYTTPTCEWHFLVATVSTKQSIISLFVDGEIAGSTPYSNMDVAYNNNFPIYIGKDRNSVRFFSGVIDDVRIYHGTLTDIQIRDLYYQNNWPYSHKKCDEVSKDTVKKECLASVTLGTDQLAPPFMWSNGAATQTISVDKDGEYWVVGTAIDGCSSKKNFVVLNNLVPNVSAGIDDTLCFGEFGNLKASEVSGDNIIEYQWYELPKRFISNNQEFMVQPNRTTSYYVMAKSESGCVGFDTVNIVVEPLQSINTQIGSIANVYPGALISIPISIVNSKTTKPINRLKCILHFKPNSFIFEEIITQGTMLSGWNIYNKTLYNDSLVFELQTSNSGITISNSGLAMIVNARAYVGDTIRYPITASLHPLDNLPCASFSSTGGSIILDTNICGLQLRLIRAIEGDDFLKIKNNTIQSQLSLSYSHIFDAVVKIQIVDVMGSIVEVLTDTKQKAGKYEEVYYISDLANGLYYCVLQFDNDIRKVPFIISN